MATVFVLSMPTLAQGAATPTQEQASESVYGWQWMSPDERLQFRNQMRALKSQGERRAFPQAHYAQMQARAEEQSVSLALPFATSGAFQRRGPGAARAEGHGGFGGQTSFATFDLDADGFVTAEEFITARERRMEQNAKEWRPLKDASGSRLADSDVDDDGR